MSLVIGLWDECVGIMVSEGRACISGPDGQFTPVAEDLNKTGYLPDGSILGITGDLVVTGKLRKAIEAKAALHTFRELREIVMPELMDDFQAKHPNNEFGAVLLGNDDGVLRSGTWSTNAPPLLSAEGGIGSTTLGCSGDTHKEAARAVRDYLGTMRKDYVHLGSAPHALKRIICDLAQKHPEINDRVYFSYVLAPEKPGGTVTRAREVFDFDRMVAAGANVTADHVLSEKATCSNVEVTQTTNQALTGLGWSVAAQGPADVYNILGAIYFSSNILTGVARITLHVYVDGNTGTDYGAGLVFCTGSTQGLTVGGSGPFVGVVNGLAAGSHTIQVYADYECISGGGAYLEISGYAFCQRVF